MRRAFALAVVFVAATALAETMGREYSLADALVAKIDSEVVTVSELRAEMEIVGWPEGVAPAGPRVVARDLVKRKLLVSQAERLKMEIPRETLEDEVDELASSGRGEEAFWARMKELGFSRPDVVRRMREVALSRGVVSLKRRSTYVPEAEVRAFYRDNRSVFGARPLSEARETIREHLATRKYQAELSAWMAEQIKSGRVRLLPLPESLEE